ncbi:unnamed protein product, partial [Angiostrongylus costaricensis]|uniref:FERM domain-containing protein n=1 Tax=Angiostrongylus costaricensis TaxID=334426 RepID=A0A0R3PS27_ANGCS
KSSHSESNVSVVSNLDSDVAKAPTTIDNGEVRLLLLMQYGDRLMDDLMNTFCDRLQAACPRKIDGCLAIQFVLVGARFFFDEEVRVDRPAHQIIFDPDRVHYVVVDYEPKTKLVVLYDSLVEKGSNVTNLVSSISTTSAAKIYLNFCFTR